LAAAGEIFRHQSQACAMPSARDDATGKAVRSVVMRVARMDMVPSLANWIPFVNLNFPADLFFEAICLRSTRYCLALAKPMVKQRAM
jgi:hypothetical protein